MPNYSALFPPKSIAPGESVYLFGVPATLTLLATDGLVRVAGVVTATTTTAHGFVPGQQVDIASVSPDSGQQFPYGFDGSFQIQTVPSTTTFTYNDPNKPNDQGDGGNATSIQAEQPAVPQAGAQVCIVPRVYSGAAPAIAFEGWWTGAPGAFEVDLQEADSDVDAAYILPSNAAYKVTTDATDTNTGNSWRVDLIPTGGRFMRPRLITRGNAVGLIVKATALA